MKTPKFLSYSNLIEFHSAQIHEYGGTLGIRDVGLLKSALEMPKAGFGDEYLHKDIFEMAAAYLFHICKNHAFVDGNKRVALMAALVFLDINGHDILVNDTVLEKMVINVASGKMTKKEIADFFRKYGRG